MKELKRRRNIERATRFKAQYVEYLADPHQVIEREFENLKSMRQWTARNEGEQVIGIMVVKTLALIYDVWEPFTTIGKKTITLADLETIVRDLREDYKPSKNES